MEAVPDSFGRRPADAVVNAFLNVQSTAAPRSRFARFLGRSPLTEASRSWYLGALGEREVGTLLAQLDPAWTVLHSVPVGTRGSDIDHLLVGPAGVFTLNSKFHEGARVWVGARRLLVAGQKTDHLRNATFEATRVTRTLAERTGLTVDAVPVIVLVRPGAVTVRQRPEKVVVLRERELVRWLRRRPAALSDEAVASLAAAAAHPATWGAPDASPPRDEEFDLVRREVLGAVRVRQTWAGCAALTVVGLGAGLGLPQLLPLFTG